MSEKLTHWKATMNPDYLGAWALQPGQEPILTITAAGIEKVVGSDGKKEECLVIKYKEKVGPGKMICNATNSRSIEKLAGTPFIEKWAGTQFQVYVENVRAFGDVVPAIRIREFKPKPPAPAPKCTVCGKAITAAYNRTPEALAQYTIEQYGKAMCATCAAQAAQEQSTKPTEEAAE